MFFLLYVPFMLYISVIISRKLCKVSLLVFIIAGASLMLPKKNNWNMVIQSFVIVHFIYLRLLMYGENHL